MTGEEYITPPMTLLYMMAPAVLTEYNVSASVEKYILSPEITGESTIELFGWIRQSDVPSEAFKA
jgi:hypothetical protein